VMSVCTGAFKLAAAGVLDGKKATTHHGSYGRLQHDFPRVLVQRGMRYVQSDPVIFTAGGLSSGIDLALHVVELYFGRGVAETTAKYMEYEGRGWMGDGTAAATLSEPAPTSHPSDGLSGGVLGNWQGTLDPGNGKPLRVVTHIWREKGGGLTGTLDSPDEDAFGIVISLVREESSGLHFEVESLGGRFDGRLEAQESEIVGTWRQHEASVPLTLRRVGK